MWGTFVHRCLISFKSFLFLFFSFILAKQRGILKKNDKTKKPLKQGSMCQTSGQLWACWTQNSHSCYSCFWVKHFNWCTVYSINCSLFICIYLFIWFVVLNAYLCIHIKLYASGPHVKAVLLLKLSWKYTSLSWAWVQWFSFSLIFTKLQ